MTYGFGSIISRAFKFANTAFPKFSSWFWIVLLTFLFTIGAVVAAIGVSLVETSNILTTEGIALLESTGLLTLPEFMDVAQLASFGLIAGVSGIVCCIIGLVLTIFFSFFIMGLFVRACKGKDMTLAHPWKMFGQGFLSLILYIIYFIPVTVITALLIGFAPANNTPYFVVCCIIIPIILGIITTFFFITALVRYAKTGKFGSAFQLGTIAKIISSAGWLRYLGFIVLFAIIMLAVVIVFCIVPIVGTIMLIFALPFLIVFEGGFFSELYECGNTYLNVKIK